MQLVDNHNDKTFMAGNLFQVVLIHAMAFGVAPFLFTWDALLFAVLLMFVLGYSMGIFHHMLLTHRSFRCAKWVENLGSLLGTLTWRGPFAGPVRYVAMHRVHHKYSDTDLDPHSPKHGLFRAMIGWFWRMPYGFTKAEHYDPLARDLLDNRFHVFLDRNVHLAQFLWGVFCFLLGAILPILSGTGAFDPVNGVRYVVYGVFVKSLLIIYMGNAVDVVNHTIGYRNYETEDDSTNSWLMGIIHGGGAISWHNNHHAHMGYFTVRKRWWEYDIHYAFLRLLGRFGLVWDIKVLDEVGQRGWAGRQGRQVGRGN